MDAELELQEAAFLFIKANSKALIEKFCSACNPASAPISVFMAGSPGAGKTEVSMRLAKTFETVPVRIDADEIRKMCPGYTGTNAHVFQKAASRGVHILYDYALENNLHLILDGTFAYADALTNIERSIKRNRVAELWYVYQDPMKAWEFTQAREERETRHVPRDVFIRAFLVSRENVIKAKEHFGPLLALNLLIKNIDNLDGEPYLNIQSNQFDSYIGTVYTEENLRNLILP